MRRNALFVSGYNRNATLDGNEFFQIGDSAMYGKINIIFDHFARGSPNFHPRTRRVTTLLATYCPCILDADRFLQSDRMA